MNLEGYNKTLPECDDRPDVNPALRSSAITDSRTIYNSARRQSQPRTGIQTPLQFG